MFFRTSGRMMWNGVVNEEEDAPFTRDEGRSVWVADDPTMGLGPRCSSVRRRPVILGCDPPRGACRVLPTRPTRTPTVEEVTGGMSAVIPANATATSPF